VGDPVLAERMRSMKVPAPVERIVSVDWVATACNPGMMEKGRRLVILACGHYTATKNRKEAKYVRCHEMILNGEDYDAFRNRS